VQYLPSGAVARRLGVTPRTLGKITGNVYIAAPEGSGPGTDLGLCVKHGARALCVPEYARPQPEERGWAYSNALLALLEQYKARACFGAAPDLAVRSLAWMPACPEPALPACGGAVQGARALSLARGCLPGCPQPASMPYAAFVQACSCRDGYGECAVKFA
jgi:hypothetical protein